MIPADATDCFRYLTDTDTMSILFATRLHDGPRSNGQATRCKLLDYRERADHSEGLDVIGNRPRVKSALACYELEFGDSNDPGRAGERLYVRAYRGNASTRKFAKLLTIRPPGPPDTGVLAHWSDLDLIIWSFPNDPRLPCLATLVHAERALSQLPYAGLSPRVRGLESMLSYDAEVVRYHPEDRCTLRCRLRYTEDGTPGERIVYAKLFKDTRAAATHRILHSLWDRGHGHRAPLVLPQPLGYDEATRVAWLSALPGMPADAVMNHDDGGRHMETIAVALASLHGVEEYAPSMARPRDHLRGLEARNRRLRQCLPSVESMFLTLLAELEEALPRLTPVSDRLIHGGFRLPQILLHRDTVGIIDLDDMARGDPAQDLAEFVVDLIFRDVTSEGPTRLVRMFLRAYRRHARWSVPKDRLRWFLTAQLIRRATRNPGRVSDAVNFEAQIKAVLERIQGIG